MDSPFLPDWLLAHAARRPEAPALDTPVLRLSYGELAGRVRALTNHLAASGLRAGDRVLVALPNSPATVVGSLAVQALGGTAVEVNREWSVEVLGGLVRQSGVRQALVWGRDARTWGRVCEQQPLERLWVVNGGPLPAAMAADLGRTPAALLLDDGRVDPALGSAPEAPRPRLDPSAAALILYTSGTTGQPRGVIQSFANIAANSRSIAQYLELSAQDRAILVLPLHYCYGRSVLQSHLLVGGSLFLENRTAFPRVVLETLSNEGCTSMAGVPLTFEIIRRQVDVATLSFPRLRYLTQAGGAMAPDTIAWVRRAFHPARLYVMYGQTEATARLSYLPPERGEDKAGSIGIAIPGVKLAVVDEAGREMPTGRTGFLVARGDNVTAGYLDAPEETAAILRGGWLWTGDLAFQDADGFFFHQGRAKEILKIGGHRVSPTEIEHAVAGHPAVAEAAVIGAPDPLLGEVVAAYVVLRSGEAMTADELRRFCRSRMPPYQVPATVTFVPALPRNQAGKLLRAELARCPPA